MRCMHNLDKKTVGKKKKEKSQMFKESCFLLFLLFFAKDISYSKSDIFTVF